MSDELNLQYNNIRKRLKVFNEALKEREDEYVDNFPHKGSETSRIMYNEDYNKDLELRHYEYEALISELDQIEVKIQEISPEFITRKMRARPC